MQRASNREGAGVRMFVRECVGESCRKDDLGFVLRLFERGGELGCERSAICAEECRRTMATEKDMRDCYAGAEGRVWGIGSGAIPAEEEDATVADGDWEERFRSDDSTIEAGKRYVMERNKLVASPVKQREKSVAASASPAVRVVQQGGQQGGTTPTPSSIMAAINAASKGPATSRFENEASEGSFSAAPKNFLDGIFYKSPEIKVRKGMPNVSAKVELEKPPVVVGTDDEESDESEEDEEVQKIVVSTPVIKKRYPVQEQVMKVVEIEKEHAKEHAKEHVHHHHHLPHPDTPAGMDLEAERGVVLGEDDSWDDIKIGGGGSVTVGNVDKSSSGTISSSSGSGRSGSDESDSGEWFYKDKHGARQGPFDSSTINAWVNAGHLPMELMITEGGGQEWQQLGEVWSREKGVDKTMIWGGGEGDDEDFGVSPIKRSGNDRNDRSII